MRSTDPRTRSSVAAAAVVALALTGCTATQEPADPSPRPPSASGGALVLPEGTPTDVVAGLDAPWEVALVDGTPLITLRNSGARRRRPVREPVQVCRTDDASTSGLAVIDDTVHVADLRGRWCAPSRRTTGSARELYAGDDGRLRSVLTGADGTTRSVTDDTDGRGQPRDGDDRILSVPLASG